MENKDLRDYTEKELSKIIVALTIEIVALNFKSDPKGAVQGECINWFNVGLMLAFSRCGLDMKIVSGAIAKSQDEVMKYLKCDSQIITKIKNI